MRVMETINAGTDGIAACPCTYIGVNLSGDKALPFTIQGLKTEAASEDACGPRKEF
jgi:hypothetical protein